MVLHIVEDILLIQTIKVFLLSIFYSGRLSIPADGIEIGNLKFAQQRLSVESDVESFKISQIFIKFRNSSMAIFHHIAYSIAFALVIYSTISSQSYLQNQTLKRCLGINYGNQATDIVICFQRCFQFLQF